MKKLLLALLSTTLLILLGACGNSDVSTGGSANSTEKKTDATKAKSTQTEDNSKTINASSQSINAIGMKVGLGEIKISEEKIEVGININNTTSKVLNFYPDQGHLVIGDMQLDANMFMTSGEIGGEVQGGVKQDAVIEFTAPEGKTIDVKSVKQIKLIFGDVTSEDFMSSKGVQFNIPVK